MSTTPEGKVKRKVKSILKKFEEHVWYDMPVPAGFGKSTLDFLGMIDGQFFAIETKRADKAPTALQQQMLAEIRAKGGITFVIIGEDSPVLKQLEHWLAARLALKAFRMLDEGIGAGPIGVAA